MAMAQIRNVVLLLLLLFASLTFGQTLNNIYTTYHGAREVGACKLPEGPYATNYAVALGDIPELQTLGYKNGMCGHVLTVNCGSGDVDVVVSNRNGGGGLDLYASSWNKATNNASPGVKRCSVRMTDKNPFGNRGVGPRCFYEPDSEKDNDYFKLLGLFNTAGRVVVSATMDGKKGGGFNGVQPYFAFHGGPFAKEGATVRFGFQDGESVHEVKLADCAPEINARIWS